jgi:hypothetical protein
MRKVFITLLFTCFLLNFYIGNGFSNGTEQACGPGFWKNHFDEWASTGYTTIDDFDTAFGVDYYDPDITLEEALNAKGGGINKIARHGTAALLNAAHPNIAYPFDVAEVISFVQNGDAETLSAANEGDCPL